MEEAAPSAGSRRPSGGPATPRPTWQQRRARASRVPAQQTVEERRADVLTPEPSGDVGWFASAEDLASSPPGLAAYAGKFSEIRPPSARSFRLPLGGGGDGPVPRDPRAAVFPPLSNPASRDLIRGTGFQRLVKALVQRTPLPEALAFPLAAHAYGLEPGFVSDTWIFQRADGAWLFLAVGFQDASTGIDVGKAREVVRAARSALVR